MKRKWILLTLVFLVLTACTADHEAMRQQLQYVSDCNRADTVFSARWLPTVDSLVAYFDRHGSANDRMMAHYVRGRVYHDMGEAPQAMECYQKAAEQADTTRSDCDLYTLYAVYGQMADLFHAQYLPDDEMQVLKVAEKIAWKDKDTLSAINTYQLLSRPYYMKSDTESVLFIEKCAHDLYLRYGFNQRAARTLLVPISIYLDRMQYDKASEAMSVFEDSSGWFDDDDNIKKGKELYYYDKGRYHLAMGRQDLALLNFKKVLQAGYIETGYRGLLSVYEQQGRSDSISKYAKLFAAANDSCYYHVNQEKVHQVSAIYDYSRQQHLADESRTKAARLRYYLVFVLLAVLAATAIAAYIYNRVRTQNLLQITQLLRAKADIQSLLEEKQAQLDNIVSKNASEIERVTQESNQTLIEHIREKKALEHQIEDMDHQLSQFSNASHEKAFLSTTIGQRFQNIRDSIPKEAPPTNLDWKQCIKTFRDHFPSYYSFITNGHALTDDQLRICMMIRQNYRESEMAFFMDADKQRINRIKLQVNSKLFGIQNSSSLRKNLKEHF